MRITPLEADLIAELIGFEFFVMEESEPKDGDDNRKAMMESILQKLDRNVTRDGSVVVTDTRDPFRKPARQSYSFTDQC